jgi:hypothetical protein
MSDPVLSENPRQRTRRTLEYFGLTIGAISIIVSIFFSLKADRRKELTLSYLSKQSLLSVSDDRSGGLEVSFRGAKVVQPWLLSVRLENSGNLPIESQDIERPLGLRLQRSPIRSARISQRVPPDLEAEIDFDSTTVQVRHALMNPGDAIEFDLLTDGEPDSPMTSFRISGISTLREMPVPSATTRPSITYWSLPTPLTLFALLISSLIGVVAIGIGLVGLVITVSQPLGGYELPSFAFDRLDPERLSAHRITGANGHHTLNASELEDPGAVADWIRTLGPKGVASDPQKLRDAAEEAIQAGREALPSKVLESLQADWMPKDVQDRAKTAIEKIELGESSVPEYLSRVQAAVRQAASVRRGWFAFSPIEFAVALLIAGGGAFLGMVLAASWRQFLA